MSAHLLQSMSCRHFSFALIPGNSTDVSGRTQVTESLECVVYALLLFQILRPSGVVYVVLLFQILCPSVVYVVLLFQILHPPGVIYTTVLSDTTSPWCSQPASSSRPWLRGTSGASRHGRRSTSWGRCVTPSRCT